MFFMTRLQKHTNSCCFSYMLVRIYEKPMEFVGLFKLCRFAYFFSGKFFPGRVKAGLAGLGGPAPTFEGERDIENCHKSTKWGLRRGWSAKPMAFRAIQSHTEQYRATRTNTEPHRPKRREQHNLLCLCIFPLGTACRWAAMPCHGNDINVIMSFFKDRYSHSLAKDGQKCWMPFCQGAPS